VETTRTGTAEVLPGGHANRGRVVRVGATVRRPLRPDAAGTHALLRHLEQVGFPGAPRLLGVEPAGDEGGQQEVLSWVPGQVAGGSVPDELATDAALASVAVLLRDLHAAVRGFDPTPYTWPRVAPPGFRPAAGAPGLVAHNDPNIDNVVFRDGSAVALIDFDLAAPADPLWDVALAVRLWAPLRDPGDVLDARAGRELARARVFADAYGVPAADRDRLADALLASADWAYSAVVAAVEGGHPVFAAYWAAKGQQRAVRSREWLERSMPAVRAALGTPESPVRRVRVG
jgi:aminoglycoside phosphotransferase (APT) family kinase protein